MEHTEAQLAALAAAGDKAAFEILVKNHEKHVYALALRLSRNREDAFDLSQEIFLRAYRTLSGFRGEASFSTWLYRLAYNLCLDYTRKMKKRCEQPLTYYVGEEEYEHEWADFRYHPETEWEKQELRTAIAAAMEKISPEQRAILTLREIQGLAYDEIADILNLPTGTVKSRLARSREALRRILGATGK